MNRFGWWRRRPHDGSRATAPGGRSRHGSTDRPIAAVLPDSDGDLSDGVVIEARLKARLLGAPVLRVDGTVVVSPGRVVELARGEIVEQPRADGALTNGAPGRMASSLQAPGQDLDRARRLIADTDGRIARWHPGQQGGG